MIDKMRELRGKTRFTENDLDFDQKDLGMSALVQQTFAELGSEVYLHHHPYDTMRRVIRDEGQTVK
jgi:hypothetical protein